MTTNAHNHEVRATLSRGASLDRNTSAFSVTLDRVMGYAITSDMLTFADACTIDLPVRKEVWDYCQPDNRLQITIDDSQVFDGFIDTRSVSGEVLSVAARDKSGRLVDEAAPFKSFASKGLLDLLEEMSEGLFSEVRLDNAENRQLISGPGGKGISGSEPAILVGRDIVHQVAPGETKAQVIDQFAEAAKVLVWSSADGRALIAGKPRQRQPPSYLFTYGGPDTDNRRSINVPTRTYRETIEDRYSQVVVVGSGRGNFENFGRAAAKKFGVAVDGDGFRGIGESFDNTKRIVIVDTRLRQRSASEEAQRLMSEFDARGVELQVTVAGHGQALGPGQLPSIYTFDRVVSWRDDEIGVEGDFYITRCQYDGSKDDSSTTIQMVPVGTELRGLG